MAAALFTASSDRTARLWEAEIVAPIGKPLRGEDAVECGVSPDGTRIVGASEDRTALVWDARTGRPIGEPLKGHEGSIVSAAFSPDGKHRHRLWEDD
jgi:WD40 repeat protein